MDKQQIGRNKNPFKWWQKNCICFPVLAKLAKMYLAIPASSTSCDRIFSYSGNVTLIYTFIKL